MLDVNESVGKSSCSSLQKEFSENDVMFTKVDVTKSEDLVSRSPRAGQLPGSQYKALTLYYVDCIIT